MTIIEILKKIISFDTTTKNYDQTKESFVWIKKLTNNLPIYTKEFSINKFLSLVITTKKTKKPRLLLQAHIDVVPGSKDMFLPKEKNNRLYGRGAWDMKFAIACYLKLLMEIGQKLIDYDLGIMITSDEEIGGENGVKALVDKGYSAEICLLPDGGEEGIIDVTAKGVWHLKVKSYGKSGPASRPWTGKNAVWNLIEFLMILRKEFAKEPCHIRDHYHNTFNLGQLNGGKVANGVPDFAEAFLDIRYVPETDINKLRKKIERIRKNFPEIKIEELILAESFMVDQRNEYFKEYVRLYADAYKKKPAFTFTHGSCDARFLSKKGVPVILSAPGGNGSHSKEEYVDLKSLKVFYEILRKFTEKIARIN